MNSDFKDLLSLFEKHQVRYLIAGGYAVIRYTEPRYTKDMDVVVGLAEGEPERISAAMAEFGFPMTETQIEQFRRPNQMIVIGRPPSRIDILNEVTGIDFEEAWARRNSVQLESQTVYFLSLGDLIEAKRAAGRPQDRLDLAKLEKAAKKGPKKKS